MKSRHILGISLIIAFVFFFLPHTVRAEETKELLNLPPKVKEFGFTFIRKYKEEISLRPGSEFRKYEIRDEDTIRLAAVPAEGIRYHNDLRLEERAFYRASSDFLNNWRLIRSISEKLERYGRVEIGFITDAEITVDPKLTPVEVPPKSPDPKVEVGFGEKKEKRVRFGMKFGSSGSLLSNKYLVSPLAYARIHLKPVDFQVRFSVIDQRTFLEAASNRAILGFYSGGSYDVENGNLNALFSRRLASGNEFRLSPGTNVASGDWNVNLLFFSPITF